MLELMNRMILPTEVPHQQSPLRATTTFRRRVRQATEGYTIYPMFFFGGLMEASVTVDIQLLPSFYFIRKAANNLSITFGQACEKNTFCSR
ncbi:hypothetical protein Plhal304r1_c013g0049311 [Plasmopara halstedii]